MGVFVICCIYDGKKKVDGRRGCGWFNGCGYSLGITSSIFQVHYVVCCLLVLHSWILLTYIPRSRIHTFLLVSKSYYWLSGGLVGKNSMYTRDTFTHLPVLHICNSSASQNQKKYLNGFLLQDHV